ncbi:MAG: hypothetical protein LBT50_06510 [Prevotellaceae bacterium]|jgi:hypothetical protein|nr:hypothetical protein [Prevotellaceae bacterium]
MRKVLVFISLVIVFVSCKKEEYKYEVWTKNASSFVDTKIDEDVIKGQNDSIAFVKALQKFLIWMDENFTKNKDFEPELCNFKLITSDGKDISSGSFLQNPKKVFKKNVEAFLSDEFRSIYAIGGVGVE